MIDIKEKKDCCGCWACANACPKQCIEMEADEEGFLYPHIDAETCIDCGLCEKVCPVLNVSDKDVPHTQWGYLLQHKDEQIRQESTSGGAFTALATWVICQGGIVFGAGYRKGEFIVEHQAVNNEEDLFTFRNSKYVQSRVGKAYKEVKKYLQEGRYVLFSGTPCQVAGLKKILDGHEYDHLICVDLVCHGIPSPHILALHIATQQSRIGGKFTNVLFRDKFYGYHYSSFSIYNEDKEKDYHKGVDTDAYLRAFFSNLSDRPACYDCKFKKRYRCSDLTLWDCFPIEQFTKEMDGKGTTRVLAQSEKGRKLVESIKDDVRLIEVDPDKLTEGVREMFHSVPYNAKRPQFFKDSNEMTPADFFNKWFPVTMKVRLNAFIRLTCHSLGFYNTAKRLFMLFYTRRDERANNV